MNEANVKALATIVEAAWLDRMRNADIETDMGISTSAEMASDLASRGVLVPSALTDRQCETLTVEWDSGVHFAEGDGPAKMRAELEAIAKGHSLPPL